MKKQLAILAVSTFVATAFTTQTSFALLCPKNKELTAAIIANVNQLNAKKENFVMRVGVSGWWVKKIRIHKTLSEDLINEDTIVATPISDTTCKVQIQPKGSNKKDASFTINVPYGRGK